MNIRTLVIPLILVFLFIATFGLPVSFSPHAHHEMGCPLIPGENTLCVYSPLLHIAHWQSVFAAVVAEALIFLVLGVLYTQHTFFKLPDKRVVHSRVQKQKFPPLNPLQELFSQGILNSKAP